MPDYKKTAPGTPLGNLPTLSASWINSVQETLAWYYRAKAAGEVSGPANPAKESSGIVKVKNLTGSDLSRGHYVQLGDYMLTDVSNKQHWYEGNLYDAAASGRIAVLMRAAKQNEIYEARILGRCTARIDVTDTDHRFAAPDDGAYVLKSAASGSIEILSANKISGTGEQELAILLGGTGGRTVKARVTTTIPAAAGPLTADWGTGGEVKLQDPTTGEVAADAITVENDNIGTSWAVDCQVTLDQSYSPPRVIGGSCGPVSWGE